MSPSPEPRRIVVTEPGRGEVRFRVNGFRYSTHRGLWTTEYVKGPSFGSFDIVPADMKTAKDYGSGERLGQFMDPSNPTRTSSDGNEFKFRE